ncbi:MAG: hypothetical protein ABJB76_02810 [Candidatus Nitrosocosmicus sp.]
MSRNFDTGTLVTLNATIIGGFLILLTISSFSPAEFPNRSIFVSIAVIIVILFSIACFFSLHDKIENAIKFSKIGFVSIIAFMAFIGAVNIINIIDPTIWTKEPIIAKIAKNNSTVINNHENINSNNNLSYKKI